MKTRMIFTKVTFLMILFILSACRHPPEPGGVREDTAQVKDEMHETRQMVSDALEEQNISLFINRTDMALNQLEEQIDDYLEASDRANELIDGPTRDMIIRMKELVVGIDFRLALLDHAGFVSSERLGVEADTERRTSRIRPAAYPYPYPHTLVVDPVESPDPEVPASEMAEYLEEIQMEIKNNLRQLNDEIVEFIGNDI